MAAKPKIILVYNYLSSFIKKDIDILSENFEVISFDFFTPKKSGTPFKFIEQLFFMLWHIWSAKLVICQFAGYHSFIPAFIAKLTYKKCIIISGGTDTVSFPSIGYGNFYKKILSKFTGWSFRLASHLAPKHKTLIQHDYTYQPNDFPQQGIFYFCKGLNKPFTVIENGYDPVKWHCTKPKRPNTFITVSGGWDYPFQYQLKGIDLIIEAAPHFPQCEFVILGVPDASIIPAKSSNVKILPPTPNNQLKDIYSECEFYMQLSMAEGFPNSICEAMLCECIPIGSNVFSIPEIVGDTGFVLAHRNADELKLIIEKAINSNKTQLAKAARQRIAAHYTEEMRKQKLVALCNKLTQ